MVNLIQEISKYAIILLVMIYTYSSFAYFRKKNITGLNICLFAVHFFGFLTLFLSTKNENLILLYGGELVYLILMKSLFHIAYPDASRILTSHICMLLVLGFIMLARLSPAKASRQFFILLACSVIASVIPFIMKKWKSLRKFAWVYGVAGVILLLVVLILAQSSYGAKLSIQIFGISIQFSEFVKISYVFFIAAMFEKRTDFVQVLKTGCLAAVHILILVASTDLGSALIFSLIFVFMVYVATKKPIYLLGGLFGGAAASYIGYHYFYHVQTRVEAWLDPWSVIESKGYQIAQSLFAIGTGGWLGMGLNEGSPLQIPVVEQDFIFSAIAEELGGLVAVCVVFICLGCLLLILNIALQMRSNFYRYMALGLACEYGVQVFLTIGGAIKLIPSTGLTLPFVSYGGSSLLSSLIMYGIIQGLYISDADKISLQESEEEKRNDKELYRMMYLFTALFFLMPSYLAYFLVVQSSEVVNNPYNLRQENFDKKVVRGTILSADGEVLAQTQINEAGEEVRVYPQNNLFSHVVGYSQSGKSGLEKIYNFQLLTSDVPVYEKVANGFADVKDDGNQLITTLNYKLQKVASDALGNQTGSVVVIEPATGKILAMVSKPDYNPNEIEKIWASLSGTNNSNQSQSYLLNRATQGLYPPGSTFKILTALEYLREYPDMLSSFSYSCTGSYEYKGTTINCYHKTVHGTVSFKEAFAKSCNGAFASMGTKLSVEKWNNLCEDFLFNQDLPFALSYVSSKFELEEDAKPWEILQTAIGQGTVQVTPFHQAMIVATIANGGVMMKPYLVDLITDAHGNLVKQYKPQVYGTPISTEEAEKLTELMTECVKSGTGYNVRSNYYQAAGKTGTAEWNTSKESHSWFVGFMPAANPEIAVSVLVEEGGAGSDKAASIANLVFQAWDSIK